MINNILWNYCDMAAGFYPVRFKIAAYLLHLAGNDYWINSIDYRARS